MPKVWPSSTLTTPSLPTFSIASAIVLPISSSPADLGQQGCRRGAVAGHVVGRGGDLADQLGALVLEDVLDLDLAGDRDAVVGDRRRTELFVEHDVAALRAEGDLDRVGDCVDAGLQGPACLLLVLQLLVSHLGFPSSLVSLSPVDGA